MVVHTPDDNGNILEDNEENDGSNVSSDPQETGSNNLVETDPNFDVLQIFQNS